MRKLTIGILMVMLTIGLAVAPAAQAQDTAGAVNCDATLNLLLLLAEENYGYVSNRMSQGDTTLPQINQGSFGPLFDSTATTGATGTGTDSTTTDNSGSTDSTDSTANTGNMGNPAIGDTANMSPEQITQYNETFNRYFGMNWNDMLNTYMSESGMTPTEGTDMTPQVLGDVAGEDPVCTQIRADVQQFLLAHLLTHRSVNMGAGASSNQ